MTHPQLLLGPEIVARNGTMRSTLRPIASKFFRVPGVDTGVKMQVARGLLMSRGLYGSGTWHRPAVAELHKIHANVMYVTRSACSEHHGEVSTCLNDQK
eukprot:11517906-Karenia_brevis.AAC.1